MRRIMLLIEYDGTAYQGWQLQNNGPTVQAAMEQAVLRLTGERVRVRGASRTDSGVHARGQVAVFDTSSRIPAERFAPALNGRLPADIVVRSSHPAAPGFDPRRASLLKQYSYRIVHARPRPAVGRQYAWHLPYRLNTEAMQAAATALLGTHDFTSFAGRGCEDKCNRRTIVRSQVLARDDEIVYLVEGRSFIYRMVRNLVGTLVDVGAGRFTPADIAAIIHARNRACAGQGAPALGLCLEWIRY